jgi:hypothetical protein
VKVERHAFISYAHIDDEVLPTEQYGWVTLFHKTLAQMLAMRLGEQVNIWRDERLHGNDVFSDEIIDRLRGSAVLISVLSPRYVRSEWCRRELESFCQAAESGGGLVVDNKARVFKVLKLPLDRHEDDELPEVVHGLLGYEFYELAADGSAFELTPSFGEKSKQEFLRRVASVAADVKRLVTLLRTEQAAPREATTVYLASVTQDRREARGMLATELERLGCTVLPDRQLPTDEAALDRVVSEMLARSRLSIHLIGTSYGLVPEGTGQLSVIELQNDLAARCAREGGLQRVIWLPEGTSSPQPPQADFIGRLHRDEATQFGGDLITGDLEALKLAVRRALERLARPTPPGPAVAAGRRRRVHLLHVEPDRKDLLDLLKLLASRVDVTRPAFAGDAAALREANQAMLLECDEVWLFYGNGDEAWKYHQLNEVRRIGGLRTERPLPLPTIVLGPPSTDDKDLLAAVPEPGTVVIDCRQGATAAAAGAIDAALAPPPGR